MPSRSIDQHKLMEAVEHDPAVARRTGISRETARDFTHADEKNKSYRNKEHVGAKKSWGASDDLEKLIDKA